PRTPPRIDPVSTTYRPCPHPASPGTLPAARSRATLQNRSFIPALQRHRKHHPTKRMAEVIVLFIPGHVCVDMRECVVEMISDRYLAPVVFSVSFRPLIKHLCKRKDCLWVDQVKTVWQMRL